MQLLIRPDGTTRCLYSEALDLARLGRCRIVRASQVEPTTAGEWIADLSPVHGPRLGPFPFRSQALQAEIDWLQRHRLDVRFPDQLPGVGEDISPSAKRSLSMTSIYAIRQFTRRSRIWSRQFVHRCRHFIQSVQQRYRRRRGH